MIGWSSVANFPIYCKFNPQNKTTEYQLTLLLHGIIEPSPMGLDEDLWSGLGPWGPIIEPSPKGLDEDLWSGLGSWVPIKRRLKRCPLEGMTYGIGNTETKTAITPEDTTALWSCNWIDREFKLMYQETY